MWVKEGVNATDFSLVDESVEFVLEEVIKEEEQRTFSEEEEKEVKKRLKDLGYLD